jgi:hypothetical protein
MNEVIGLLGRLDEVINVLGAEVLAVPLVVRVRDCSSQLMLFFWNALCGVQSHLH